MAQINSIHGFKNLSVKLEFLVGLHFSALDLSTQQRYENLFYKRCHSSSHLCPLLELGHRIDKNLSFILLVLFSSPPFLSHKHTSNQHFINCALENRKVFFSQWQTLCCPNDIISHICRTILLELHLFDAWYCTLHFAKGRALKGRKSNKECNLYGKNNEWESTTFLSPLQAK